MENTSDDIVDESLVVLQGGVAPLSLPLLLCLGGLSLLALAAFLCGLERLCRREEEPRPGPHYSVAISNSLFREGLEGEMPCLNCRLIEMGEMACYAGRCSQCHRVPPCLAPAL